MAIISSFTLIRSVSLFHLTAAYFFLSKPKIIADQNVVFMLGESMQLPHAVSLDKPNDATAFLAVILAFLGISDLTAASLTEQLALEHWLSNVPVRLLFLFGLTGYAYLFKEGGIFGGSGGLASTRGVGENLQNSLVFTFGFMEIAIWFWIFLKLREERVEMVKKHVEKLQAEEGRL